MYYAGGGQQYYCYNLLARSQWNMLKILPPLLSGIPKLFTYYALTVFPLCLHYAPRWATFLSALLLSLIALLERVSIYFQGIKFNTYINLLCWRNILAYYAFCYAGIFDGGLLLALQIFKNVHTPSLDPPVHSLSSQVFISMTYFCNSNLQVYFL